MTATEPPRTTGALAKALAQVQAAIPTVAKDNVGIVKSDKANYKYNYADLSDVTAAILPLLGRNGLSWTALPTMVRDADGPQRFVLRYSLMHEGGESLDGEWLLPDPQRSTPQQLGSHITYARRYSLCAVTGVAPGGDDDDAAAAQSKPADYYEPPRRAAPADPQPSRDWAWEIDAALATADASALRRLWKEAHGLDDVRSRIESASKDLAERDKTAAPSPSAGSVRPEQHKHMHALWKSGEVENREQRLAITGVLVGHPVASSSELTAAEADTVVTRLRDADKGTGALYKACSRWLDEAAAAVDTDDTTGGES